ncbi:hypothetical protein QFZ81_000102 [Paenibacillus sp. V4I9]|uniref:hypothetical protein n=1 Tax=Paenibacillus sp. V4I9 TaxID=3042308 RepID=UPI0027886B04|nr:hypothetical protein [Paenibacillus sp. V4I9]MDQ0885014.1 hypothetical protein [Paenibacillus sp. V4I9]
MENTYPDFYGFMKEELVEYCKSIYNNVGIEGLSYVYLKNIGNLYMSLYKNGITQTVLVNILGLTAEYSKYKHSTIKWSYDNILEKCKEIVKEYGYLPPAEWLRKNGYGSLVTALYQHQDKSFADLRNDLNANEGGSFVLSKNGMRWLSHPEASFSNFLYARGIKHDRGRKYPKEYSGYSKSKYGIYDVQFYDNQGNLIDVEIWGDRPNGHKEDYYAEKRKNKEKYNAENNSNFLGIGHKDCFDELKLTSILEPYISSIEPYVFQNPTDKIIPSTHWSNADELLEYCREFVKQFKDQEFPTEEWLRKRGKWKDREGLAYNTLSIYIKTWLGGVRNLRRILGQENVSTVEWSKEKALNDLKEWYEKYNLTTGSAIQKYRIKKLQLSREEYLKACSINHAIFKYVGSMSEAMKILGVKIRSMKKTTR